MGWPVDDIDLDLGTELNSSYNLSEALLFPSLTKFKQEAPSPTNTELPVSSTSRPPNGTLDRPLINTNNSDNNDVSLQQLLQEGQDGFLLDRRPADTDLTRFAFGDSRFQYVLAAATSTATKCNEDTLTYLNQGQSYEIRLKKLGDLSAYRGKILKSIIRICFHERRLQYMEREQMSQWQSSHPGERLVEVDLPLSYGLCHVAQPQAPGALNIVEVMWDPMKEVGVYVKVNCISTEFTAKKHGGEKGVPFRIQVETYVGDGDSEKALHVAMCQIKVFKLKGADRKHKQDREKIMRRPPSEQEKYQPSYDCTVLNDVPCTSIVSALSSPSPEPTSVLISSPMQPCVEEDLLDVSLKDASPPRLSHWLQSHRFASLQPALLNFSGQDVLCLSRDDLIQICGVADGIRLYNALHARPPSPALTCYVCTETGGPFHALYLHSCTQAEFAQKIDALAGIWQYSGLYKEGPGGILVTITDDVVANLPQDSLYKIEKHNDRLILKNLY
ncbi:alpha-globin transcription factor CP2-like [Ctenocephalides felis]|uniref:alpha-globin transcription factor CP2-like n=1 Tax=Ctenocephalides felis TaxID=7515 RepID=UPI000E6E4549|nr:alpha-globin transcription factor CP2-like [Ctenocephalides felis]XP_026478390.1 alpha-globin transcription factor CP2-like [Ctenocephalides felis]XP_026478391.1 alpha-globin transcription factor CP2-like [Ctenocephalides felis]XP_026478392.1 alpha-globin transcription factor CP2-like [Ctenocephalides felis]